MSIQPLTLGLPGEIHETLMDFGPSAPESRQLTVDIDGINPDSAQQLAIEALMDGASSILYWVHHDRDVARLAEGIDTSIAPIHWVGNLRPEALAECLPSNALGLYNVDPLEQRVRSGSWFTGTWSSDLDRIRHAESLLPAGMAAVVSNALLAAPRGPEAQLSWALASLRAMAPAAGRPVGIVIKATQGYLETVAMAQAMRLLWTENPLWIVGQAALSDSSDDPADLVDLALQAQALALGGCRDLWISPIHGGPQAARWARHQGLVLYYESGLFQHDYPLRGSYLLEDWTAQLAESARVRVDAWNARGGLPHLLDQNLDPWT